MSTALRKISSRIAIGFTIAVCLCFVISVLQVYLDPRSWWVLTFFGLIFPVLSIVVFILFVSWVLAKSRWALLPLASLILAIPNIRNSWGFHFSSNFDKEVKEKNSIRILSWNVSWFDGQKKTDASKKSSGKQIFDYIKEQSPEILCLQEFLNNDYREEVNSTLEKLEAMGFRYHYYVPDYIIRKGNTDAGSAIFSKLPIVNNGNIQYNGSLEKRSAEHLLFADIKIPSGDTIRVFTTHLQSFLLKANDYRDLEIIRNADDSLLSASKSILRKLKAGYISRANQAEIVKAKLGESPYPELITGDFNDVPNSYAYFTIKGSRTDAFLARSWGLGRTFNNVSPTLRIDYIITNPGFQVLSYRCEKLPYSDHFPVLADLRWIQP